MKLTKEMLIDWIDRPLSNSDLDLINYIIGLQNNRDKAIEFIENHFLYHYGSYKAPIVFEDNYIQEIVDILKGGKVE